MARKGKGNQAKADSYRHDDTRKNIPEAGLVDFVPAGEKKAKKAYCWDPRESPQLIWAGKAGMKTVEVDETASIEVPLVNLHIHERVSTEAILRSAQRKDAQRSLFADPELEFSKEIQFYQHDVDWSNRMILGDSLLVMNSLLEREGMRGSVQCIYMDPPYGIKYASNFQPRIDQRDVKDGKDEDLTREVMQVQAFRDTWELGVHSYLTYLRDRLLLCRELLADSGSIFVQIGDENVHRVRCLMDEVFGEENFHSLIAFKKTLPLGSSGLAGVCDYLLWYVKDATQAKYRELHVDKPIGSDTGYTWVELEDGQRRKMTPDERTFPERLPKGQRPFFASALASSGYTTTCMFDFDFEGQRYKCGSKSWRTNEEGMTRLIVGSRLIAPGALPCFITYHEDFPVQPLHNLWDDTHGATDLTYAVQTSQKVIARCILMTTDPGDLVLDPTCGSGTTAYVAEQWGRRWITMDTSRVALAIARHRLMAAAFDYYKLRHPTSGVSGGFVYKTVPHITLKSIAQNTEIDEIAAEFQPQIEDALRRLNEVTGKNWKEWEVPRENALLEEAVKKADDALKRGEGRGEMVDPSFSPTPEAREFWRLKREMQSRIDASIARNAPMEELVDKPEKESGIVRVSGPFTMEALPNVAAEFNAEVVEEVMSGDAEFASSLGVALFRPITEEAVNAAAYINDMIEKIRATGVYTAKKKAIKFQSIRSIGHPIIHAEGEFEVENDRAATDPDLKALKGKAVKCAVIFGPQNGAISEVHVRDAVRSASPYDALLFCGYEFTGPAQEVINSDPIPGKRLLMATIAPDTAMADLLKDTKASQLFTLVGEPDVVIYRQGDASLPNLLKDAIKRGDSDVSERAKRLRAGEIFVELRGVDIYDPISGKVTTQAGENVHAIFIDHDYDGKSFCICQAMFPNKADSWKKIGKSLKGAIDEEAFEAMRTLVSLPFKAGEKIQVKVIDARGNSIVKTVSIG
ncbi:MAG: site-specific DNA-methyltransferase [Fimbriimonadales bacterium]|nr:site-specific DNA-methyltransferase [Fimbriimonadales bacterium]